MESGRLARSGRASRPTTLVAGRDARRLRPGRPLSIERGLSLARIVDGVQQDPRRFLRRVKSHRVLRFDEIQ